jgi:hypothetical protein
MSRRFFKNYRTMEDRSHPDLVKLDSLRKAGLSYKGWEKDLSDAEDAHEQRSYSADFPKVLRKMKVKQKLHEGDRSHPRLVALDAIVPMLSYPGFEADVEVSRRFWYLRVLVQLTCLQGHY